MSSSNIDGPGRNHSRRRRGNYNELYVNDNDDDIPPFANFDDNFVASTTTTTNNIEKDKNNRNKFNGKSHDEKLPTQGRRISPIPISSNNYVSPTKLKKERKNSINSPPNIMTKHLSPSSNKSSSTKKSKMTPSPKASSSSSSNLRKTSINHYDIAGEYDKEAASDYKWAKMQATNELTKVIIPIENNRQSPNPSIHKPKAGLVRSMSAGGSSRDFQNDHRSQHRSMTPDEKSMVKQYQNYNRLYHNGDNCIVSSKDIRTRQRSKSPGPQLPRSSSSNQQQQQQNHENNNGYRSNNSSRNRSRRASQRHKDYQSTPYHQQHLSKEEIKRRKYYEKKSFTFQNPLHELVAIRVNDLSTRIAFERVKPITIQDLEKVVVKTHGSDGGTKANKDNIRQKMNKLSPSPQYVELLDAMSKIKTTRHLCWSPSVSREADPFDGWGEEEDHDGELRVERTNGVTTNQQRKKMLLRNKRREVMAKRFGLGCQQIDPEEYVQKTLLDHAPLLTNVRRRLPMRSDVGFPRATEAEISLKQSEVAKEAQMEEVSPRLIVMLSSDDVGNKTDVSVDEIIDGKVLQKLKYRQPGMPFAGKEFTLLKNMKKKSSIVLDDNSMTRAKSIQHEITPDVSSFFAPPIDSGMSSSEMWRFRPFSDRSPGMSHSVVAPIDVKFPAGNIEPLVCTLALYCLPQETNSGSKTLRGKISEDFIFPAGEWGNHIEEKAGEILARQFGIKQNSSNQGSKSQRRVKKALFSFDPMTLSHPDGINSLFLVMNVQKVTHRDAGLAYINQSTAKSANTFSKKTLSGMLFGGGGGTSSLSSRQDTSTAKKRAKEAFDNLGCQFLTPFCFGIAPLFPQDPEITFVSSKRLEWPHGVTQCMSMFSHPVKPESHDSFVDRISKIALTNLHSNIVDEVANSSLNMDASFDDDSNIIAIASEDSVNSRSIGSRRMRPRFKFKKRNNSKRALFETVSILDDDIHLIDGTAIVFTSKIGPDFSQTLLQQPLLFEQGNIDDQHFPRLLVDVCGDSAIMVNPEHSTVSKKKRSNLIRLVQSSTPSGYSDSCEVREILYLPLQNEMGYTLDSFLSPRPSINLLYLYPTLIRKESSDYQEKGRNQCYSVRVQLVKQQMETNKRTGAMPSYVPTKSIYNSYPGGESLLQSVCTKIPLGATGKHGKLDIDRGIPLQDEIKIRLPDVLDGSHYLQFTLFGVTIKADDKNGDSLTQSIIGDTFIPLSSSSTREAISGKRVSTIIPNGLHRIKIESFQVQVESRLVSTLHTSDPSVATIIRDFATVDDRMLRGGEYDSIGDYRHLNRITSKASEHGLYFNFNALVFLHLRAFLTIGTLEFNFSSKKLRISRGASLKIEFLKSFLKIIDKSKKLLQQVESENGIKRLIKKVLDSFDDVAFYQNGQAFTLVSSPQSISNSSLESDQDVDTIGDQALNIDSNQVFTNKISEDVQKLNTKNKTFDAKSVHSRYADNAVPFSRKAYGISTIDRMKAEAEIYEEGQTFNELYDDDETVVTASTWQTHPHLAPLANSFSINRSDTSQFLKIRPRSQELDSTLETVLSGTEDHIDSFTPFERARSIARKVNHVAQIFVAPCTAPNLERPIQAPVRRTLSRIRKSRVPVEVRENGLVSEYNQFKKTQTGKAQKGDLFSTGSDVEEEIESSLTHNWHWFPYPNSPDSAKLRGLNMQINELTFSIPHRTDISQKDAQLPFLYELLWAVWLHLSNVKNIDTEETHQDYQLFIDHIDLLLPLSLKSLALRCLKTTVMPEITKSVVFDKNHMLLLEPLIEIIANGFVKQIKNNRTEVELAIEKVLDKSDAIIDFFNGLLALVHPAQISWLILRYFETLRCCEEDQEVAPDNIFEVLITIRASRQLRLRAAEKLASIPRFIALNFPHKFLAHKWQGSNISYSWTNQVLGAYESDNLYSETSDGVARLPRVNWLADILLNECFLICSQSCESIVNKSISQVKSKIFVLNKSAMRKRIKISTEDLAHYHSIGYHSISLVYDLILRAHASDSRYQTEEARSRIAGIFVVSVINSTLTAFQSLSKMNVGDKVRNIWLLCVLYILQEAPEVALRQKFNAMCKEESGAKESNLGKFIRVLKLCTTSFQSFTEKKYSTTMAPWLLQESFNIISASSILLVDECYEIMSNTPYEQSKMVETTLDLLLQIISAPLSSVTLLRALGAASQVLDKIGASKFLATVSNNLQHWGRIIFTMMNSISLSVRSMAVDWTVSLFGSLFNEDGNIDEVVQVFLTVLPEVVAREIALYCVNGLINAVECVETSLWPLRRAIADIEEANPLDDDRVDVQLSPSLRQFCRACQAIIDGVLIELRLQGNNCKIVDTNIMMFSGKMGRNAILSLSWAFDADEESLFEAASFFTPESCPMQRIRWLLTLKRLHEAKGQWVEAGETLILCAKTVAEAIPHIRHVWRPCHFTLWTDSSVAPWLDNEISHKSNIIKKAMDFAHEFLEPSMLRDVMDPATDHEQMQLPVPTIPALCKILALVTKEAIAMYDKEENGMDPLAFSRLEELLKLVMGFVEDHTLAANGGMSSRRGNRVYKSQIAEEIATLRKVSATINELVTKMAERIFLAEKEITAKTTPTSLLGFTFNNVNKHELFFVKLQLIGKKSSRFLESTTIPTFLDWDIPHICRVPCADVLKAMDKVKYSANRIMKSGPSLQKMVESEICIAFAEPYISFLQDESPNDNIKFCTEIPNEKELEQNKSTLYLLVAPVRAVRTGKHQTKKFQSISKTDTVMEITLAKHFPCALSRQATLITRMLYDSNSQQK